MVEQFFKGDDSELLEIFRADQEDRQPKKSKSDPSRGIRDREHRARVRKLREEGRIRTGEDHFRAAVVLLHGRESQDYEEALEIARRGSELEPEQTNLRALCGLIQDRLLLSRGEPQWYGTQRELKDGRVVLCPLDPDAVTDEERRAMGLPTLEERYQELERLNAPTRRSSRDALKEHPGEPFSLGSESSSYRNRGATRF